MSPAWFSWVGTQPALEAIERIGIDAIHAHDVALANRFRAGVGLEPGDSAIVSTDLPKIPGVYMVGVQAGPYDLNNPLLATGTITITGA